VAIAHASETRAPAPSPPREPEATAARPSWAGPRITGLALLAIGIIALVATFAVPGGAEGAWALSGPRLFPLAASIGLILCSLAFLARATIWPDADLGAHAGHEAADTDWVVPGLVAVGLMVYLVLIEPLGYPLATALFFPFCARVLGSRSLVRDLVAGAGLRVGVYLLFTRMLAVALPSGLLGF
jgi:putative tricarboxylic transport membrane protein